MLKLKGRLSTMAEINTSIVGLQGSGIGSMLYVVMESDLCTLFTIMNTLIKYADDTNLLVPSDSDIDLTDLFD